MCFCLSDICQSSGSFEFLKVSNIGTFGFCYKTDVLEIQLLAARNFSKVSLHFNKIPHSLKQVLQTYSEICAFCVLQKIVLLKQSAKIAVKVPWKSCDEI